MSDIEPAAGLEASGMQLWESVTEVYVLTPSELSMLAEAARTSDELVRLEQAVRDLPELTTRGSTGQLRPHPLLGEIRAHRQLLERLTTALALPNVDQQEGATAAQRHARRAAMARWQQRGNDGNVASQA
jgi:hypothetical protein